jgi:hypothetical protein
LYIVYIHLSVFYVSHRTCTSAPWTWYPYRTLFIIWRRRRFFCPGLHFKILASRWFSSIVLRHWHWLHKSNWIMGTKAWETSWKWKIVTIWSHCVKVQSFLIRCPVDFEHLMMHVSHQPYIQLKAMSQSISR